VGAYKPALIVEVADSFDEDVSRLLGSFANVDPSLDLMIQYIATLGQFTSIEKFNSLSDAELLTIHQGFCLIYDRLEQYLPGVTVGLLNPRAQYVKVMEEFLMQ
jgi:hypothetical protein